MKVGGVQLYVESDEADMAMRCVNVVSIKAAPKFLPPRFAQGFGWFWCGCSRAGLCQPEVCISPL